MCVCVCVGLCDRLSVHVCLCILFPGGGCMCSAVRICVWHCLSVSVSSVHLFLCVRVCLLVCLYTSAFLFLSVGYVSVYVCMYAGPSFCLWPCMSVSLSVVSCVSVSDYICLFIYVILSVCFHADVLACQSVRFNEVHNIYTYTDIHLSMHIYIYIYIYMATSQ